MTVTIADRPDTVLRLERHLPAPVQTVWQVWTQPEHLAHWFFPNDVEILESDFEPLAKPTWRTVMRGLESGNLFPVRGDFVEVSAPTRLVFTHGWEDENGAVPVMTRVTVTLAPDGDGTKLIFLQEGLSSAASREGHLDGWSQVLDNLAGYITSRA